MIELQKLKIWAKAGKEKASKKYANAMCLNKYAEAINYKRKFQAFSLIIEGVGLLLLNDFANTTLGEVPQVVSVENQESQKAVEGATPVVRQNEQTKENKSFECDFPKRKCRKQCITCYVKYVYE